MSTTRLWQLVSFLLLASFSLGGAAGSAWAEDLGGGQLSIAGTRLEISPESQTVPFETPTIVRTELAGFDPGQGVLPSSLRVLADFVGPEIDGILPLETRPGEPFRIPRLSLQGEYLLENIRLVDGETVLRYAEPRSAAVLVTQVLVTRVSSRPLSLDEIRSYGIVVGEDNFRAFSFDFGFAVDGEVVDYNVPVIWQPGRQHPEILTEMLGMGASTGTTAPRFRPPKMAPFTLELERRFSSSVASGGCENPFGCEEDESLSLPGVILFPTDISQLHQFFSVVLVAQNDAPEGDALVIRDLAARVKLPPGLRQAETDPPTPLGVPIPVRVPGEDGELGTADDLTFLVAQASGQAEVLVEGVKEGTHIVEFDLEGTLEGLPSGEVERLRGKARGAVLVRDSTFGVTITHPDTVRVGEEYSLLLTVSNTSITPANLLTVSLPSAGLSGAEVVGEHEQSLETLEPGESELVEFRLRSLRTGRVVASSVRTGTEVTPRIELTMGVGELDIPLSPTSIIFPKAVHSLPPTLVRRALPLVGLGFSVATAPPASLDPEMPQPALSDIDEKVYWLSQAGRHVSLGEEVFDAVAVLAAEWTGARDPESEMPDWEWDALRRRTDKGARFGATVAEILGEGTTAESLFERFFQTTAFIGPLQGALVSGSGATLTITSRTSGQVLAGGGFELGRSRGLPFSDLYALDGGQMAFFARPEAAGYRLDIEDPNGGSVDLELVAADASGALHTVSYPSFVLSGTGGARLDYASADFFAGDMPVLQVDADGDGFPETQLTPTVTPLSPRPFAAVAAVQNAEVDPSGHVLEVLFTQDVDISSLLPKDPQHFTLPGKVSNGGLVPRERDLATIFELIAENPFEGLRNTRVVQVVFNNPVSPYLDHDLTIRDLAARSGGLIQQEVLPVQTTAPMPGTLVEGTVYGPDGEPAPFARVELFEIDYNYLVGACRQHRTAAVQADAAGRFLFDYVRRTDCGDRFQIAAADPLSGHNGTVHGRVRFIGETQSLDIRMLGRGTVQGRVTYDDGSVPETLQVIAWSPAFTEGRRAQLGADGAFTLTELPVGTITLAASDRQGSFVYQTVEIPVAGAVTERDLVIIRRAPDTLTGSVRGTALEDGEPAPEAYLALYVDGNLVGVERSDFEGRFDFGTVPVGLAEIEAFDGLTGLRGAQVFFDLEADRVHDIDVLLLDERGVVEGHVYRRTGSELTPLEGAVVWVSGTPFNTVTDAAGFYRLEGVFAGTRQVLAADLERQVQTSARVTVTGGVTLTRDLHFVVQSGPSAGIAGQVLDENGSPVYLATVHLDAGNDQWFHEAVTDVSGYFALPDLGPGGYEVHAFKGEKGAVKTTRIRFEGETPYVTLQFKKGTIRGTTKAIDESGEPVGVVSLVTYRTTVPRGGLVDLDWQAHTIETAADGSFEIPDVLAGRYVLTISNAFHGEKTIRGEIFFDGEVREHDLVFQRNGEIRGVVLDHDGVTPVEGAQVFLRHPSFTDYDVRTDADGHFRFPLLPPTHRTIHLDIVKEEGTVFRRARIGARLTRFGQELDVEATLPKQGTVSGFVEDANGQAVPGAVVTLKEHCYPWRRIVQNADGDGYYSFTNIFQGKASLAAKAPSLGGLGGKTNTVVSEEALEVFTLISLEPTGEIEGGILHPGTGEAVSGAQVSLYRDGSLFDTLNADSDGAFRFQLLPLGRYRLRVFDSTTGRYGVLADVDVEFNNQIVAADIVLEARGEVEGHLYEPTGGVTVPGATIKLRTDSIVDIVTFSSTDVDGYFEFLGIPEGRVTLSTREPGGRRRASGHGEITEEGERITVDLFLEASGRVVGTVLSPVGAPEGPFANANTTISQDHQVVGASLENPFAFDGLIAGRSFHLEARELGGHHRGRASGSLSEEGEEVTVDVRMMPIGSVLVSVRDSFGNAVAGASILAKSRGFYGSRNLFGGTDGLGFVLFEDIGEGSITAWARDPITGFRGSGSAEITLEGEQARIDIQLEDSGSVTGRVVLVDGVTPAIEALVVLKRGSRTLTTFTDENGDFEILSVPLGSFSLYAQEHLGPGQRAVGGSVAFNGEAVDLGTITLDEADPRVLAFDPVAGSRDLALDTAVSVTFSEPLDRSRYQANWFRFKKLSGGSVGFQATWADGDTRLILTPTSPLASFRGYEFIVQDAFDLAGRRLVDKARTVFHTVDVQPPTLVDIVPRNAANQVPVDSDIRLTFSEPVRLESLSGSSLQLSNLSAGGGLTTTFLLLPGERQVLVTPTAGLVTDTQYQMRVVGAEDGSGNIMTTPVLTTFWTPDTVPPSIDAVTFPNGTDHVSGDDIPVELTVSDLRGVARVRLEIGEWSYTQTSEPFHFTLLAPVVSSAEAVEIRIEVEDLFGNLTQTTRDVQIEPRQNASAPEIQESCVRDGQAVVAGIPVELRFDGTDDEAIESWTFSVDGVEIERRTPVNLAAVSESFVWVPPAAAAPGDVFTARFEARDFAGNIGARDLSLVVPAGTILKGGRSLFDDYQGQDLYLAGGTFLLRDPLNVASLTVLQGTELDIPPDLDPGLDVAGLLHLQCTARLTTSRVEAGMIDIGRDGRVGLGHEPRLEMVAGGLLRLEPGAEISALGRGYGGGDSNDNRGEAPAGLQRAERDNGGSHGGHGIKGEVDGERGEVYGSVARPQELGGGGSAVRLGAFTYFGSPGGGSVYLVAGTLEVDGAVRANGSNENPRGGPGAGGSVWIEATTVRGEGVIEAQGRGRGTCQSCSGSSGGGRVAIWADLFDGFDPETQARAWGGEHAGRFAAAGTVYYRLPEHDHGALVIDNGMTSDGVVRGGIATELPGLGGGDVSNIEVVGADLWLTAAEPFRERWLGASVVLEAADGGDLGTFEAVERDGAGRLRLQGAAGAASALSYRGEYRFDRLVLDHDALLTGSDRIAAQELVVGGEARLDGSLEIESLRITEGGVLRPASGGVLDLEVPGTLTIEAGAVIDASGLGYAVESDAPWRATAPPWVGVAGRDYGGSHGGRGIKGSEAGPAGEVYGSVYAPQLRGASGATKSVGSLNYLGRPGGGAVRLKASVLELDGEIRVDGNASSDSYFPGTGAGGSVWLQANVLRGAGSISAHGAASGSCASCAGAGGGGRVAIDADIFEGFDPVSQVEAWGGRRGSAYAAPGTLWMRSEGQDYGSLIIDNGEDGSGVDRSGPPTELPTLGAGMILEATPAGADLWVSAENPLRSRWWGAHMELLGADGSSLGIFRVLELDAADRALLEGAGAVAGASSYRGEYRFDEVRLLNGAGLDVVDPVVGPAVVLEGVVEVDGVIEGEEVIIKSGATVRPASGTELRFKVSGRFILEAGATIDLAGKGYAGGSAFIGRTGKAPEGVGEAGMDFGGSHGGSGHGWEEDGPAGEVYDSVYFPRFAGGGGSAKKDYFTYAGKPGGGFLSIEAGEVQLDGQIRAEGLGGCRGASGAGGGVFIDTGELAGAGLIIAHGGTKTSCASVTGSGGGGRVAIHADVLTGFDPATQVNLGGGKRVNRYAAAGTLFVKTASHVYGDLLVNQGGGSGLPVARTVLPSIYKGRIGSVVEEGAHAWVEPEGEEIIFSVGVQGMWLRVDGVDFRVIGERADRRGLLLEGAAGALSPGQAYLGLYKFDQVQVDGEARLQLNDHIEATTWQVAADSEAVLLDVEGPTVTWLSPADGLIVSAGEMIQIEAEVSDATAVESVIFTFGDRQFVDMEAPYSWILAAPAVSESQDLELVLEALDPELNLTRLVRTVHVEAITDGSPPTIAVACPSSGALLGPGLSLAASVDAAHGAGIEKVELLTAAGTLLEVDYEAPFSFSLSAPADSVEGDVLDFRLRATSFAATSAETALQLGVVEGAVLSADQVLAADDLTLDGQSVIVVGSTLTVEGVHSFRDLVILDGGALRHPPSDGWPRALDIDVERDVYVACGGVVDAQGLGYPAGTALAQGGESASPIFMSDDFEAQSLGSWQIVDEGTSSGPSSWSISGGALRETTNITSGTSQLAGSFALWPDGFERRDYRLSLRLRSTDDDWMGVLFRYVDAANYYLFSWKKNSPLRQLWKKENGVMTLLDGDAVAYNQNAWHQVSIFAHGSELEVWIDGEKALEAVDDQHVAGTFALFNQANQSTYFDDVVWSELAASPGTGGSHGGLGGGFDGRFEDAASTYGNLFDPRTPGGGGDGDGVSPASGGGIVRLRLGGTLRLDGAIDAAAAVAATPIAHGAGGSIRLEAQNLVGAGRIDAGGGGGEGAVAGGGGGRIALFAAAIDADLLARTTAYGGDAGSEAKRGGAGTLFVKLDSQALGDLILDNGGLVAGQVTPLPSIPVGLIDEVSTDAATDLDARFRSDLAGLELIFNGDSSATWTVLGHAHFGHTLELDVSSAPHPAVVGTPYEGLLRLDRVIVRGGARGLSAGPVSTTGAPEIDAISSFTADRAPELVITSPADGALFRPGDMIDVTVTATSDFGLGEARLEFDGEILVDGSAPFTWSVPVPVVDQATTMSLKVVAYDHGGHLLEDFLSLDVEPFDAGSATSVSILCPSVGAWVAPGTGFEMTVEASDDNGIASVEWLLDGVPMGSDAEAPYSFPFLAPASAVDGDVLTVTVRATSLDAGVAETTLALPVRAATVLSADTVLAAGDMSLDGQAVVVAAGRLSVEGPHAFAHLAILDGAGLTYPAAALAETSTLEVDVAGDLFLACGGEIDAVGRGHASGFAPTSRPEGPIYLHDDFSTNTFADWQVVLEAGESASWTWRASPQDVREASNARDNYLIWPQDHELADYRFSSSIYSNDDDWIGLAFRWQDVDNYYRVGWSRQANLLRIQKKEAGVMTTVTQKNLAYAKSRWYRMEVVARGARLMVLIDGVLHLDAEDASHGAGGVGLFNSSNASSYFDNVLWAEIGAMPDVGASHGGQGGAYDGSARTYGGIFDPSMPGASGGGLFGGAGGGVVRLAVAGQLVVDGVIDASAAALSGQDASGGAGGSVRLDAAALVGQGAIRANGGGFPGGPAAGGGGRVALYAGSLGTDFVVEARGGDASSASLRGAAGTLFVRRDGQAQGELILDNGGLVSDQRTVLPSIPAGVVDAADASSITDVGVSFAPSVAGLDLFFDDQPGSFWRVLSHQPYGETLTLDVSGAAHPAAAGTAYEGIYRFDGVAVRGAARAVAASRVESDQVPEVDAGSEFIDEYDVELTLSHATGTSVLSGGAIDALLSPAAGITLDGVLFELAGQSLWVTEAPYRWQTSAPVVTATETFELVATVFDHEGHHWRRSLAIDVASIDQGTPPTVEVLCPSSGAWLAPGTGFEISVAAADENGIAFVDLIVDGESVANDATAPFTLAFIAPAAAQDGEILTPTIRATSIDGGVVEHSLAIPVRAATVLSGDTFLAADDSSLEAQTVVLAAGILTVEGQHQFAHLAVLDGATLTHPSPAPGEATSLDLGITGDAFLACGGVIDVTGRGYGGGFAPPQTSSGPIYLADDFSTNAFPAWQVMQETTESPNWTWRSSSKDLRESSNAHHNYLIWPNDHHLADYRFSSSIYSNDNDWIGLAFRFTDVDNLYRVKWSKQDSILRLEKREAGVVTHLAQKSLAYQQSSWHRMEVVAVGDQLQVSINGVLHLEATDTTFGSGGVGLYNAYNASSYFDNVLWAEVGAMQDAGGAHGGEGGGGVGGVYGSLFDPKDAGAGGGGLFGGAGGGVVRLTVGDQLILDGALRANGESSGTPQSFGAGGSVRIDAVTLIGAGSIEARGGGLFGGAIPAGGGGRVALHAGSVDAGLVGRVDISGGDASASADRGAAGTLYVLEGGDSLGHLILDNDGRVSDRKTPLPSIEQGVIESVSPTTITDDEASFRQDVVGLDLFFGGDASALWRVLGLGLTGQTLELDVSTTPHPGTAGGIYRGLYRFDRLTVRGMARGEASSPVQSVEAPEIEAGATWSAGSVP